MNFKKNYLYNIYYNKNEILNKYKKVHNFFLNVDTYCKYLRDLNFHLELKVCISNPFTL